MLDSLQLSSNLIRWLKRNSRKLSDDLLSAALVLLGLDLEPARNILESLYSPDPRDGYGREAKMEALGKPLREKLAELGCELSKIRVQKIAIDVEKYPHDTRSQPPRSDYQSDPEQQVTLLFCGRFVEKKRIAICSGSS